MGPNAFSHIATLIQLQVEAKETIEIILYIAPYRCSRID